MTMNEAKTSQPIRIQNREGGLSHAKSHSSSNLKISQSLGTHAPGRLLSRHMSNVSDIVHAGYLLKRSNKPFVRLLSQSSFAEEQSDAVPSTSPLVEDCPLLHHRTEVDIFNASDLDMSSASSQYPSSPAIPQHEALQLHRHDSESQEFALRFLGVDDSLGLFSQQLQQTSRTNSYPDISSQYAASSPLAARTPPTKRSEPLRIPTPDSAYSRRDSFRRTRRSSEPTLVNSFNNSPDSLLSGQSHRNASAVTAGSSGGRPGQALGTTPTDVIEHDQHVWRAKYCVLEHGILYFYRHQIDADTAEARLERQQLLQDLQHQQPPPGTPGAGTSGVAVAASAMTVLIDGAPPLPLGRPSLAMSPVTRQHGFFSLTQGGGGEAAAAAHPAFPRICEKYVALNTVGAVRSAELEYGPHSFELTSEHDEEPLILRAQSSEDMNEWIFQMHRSIASYVMDIMESYTLGGGWSNHNKGNLLFGANDVSPRVAMTLSPRVNRTAWTTHGAGPIPSSLNHGHGRNLLHRRRAGSVGGTTIRVAQSFQEDASPMAMGFPTLASQAHAARTPPQVVLQASTFQPQDQQFRASPEFSAPQSDYPETERPPPAKPGKYLPPHLRNKQAASSPVECVPLQLRDAATQRYVPPQLRGPSSKYVPPFLRNRSPAAYVSIQQRSQDISLQVAPDEMIEEDIFLRGIMFDEADLMDPPCESGIKLGGCADPLLVEGSILDAMYIPRKSSRLGKMPTVPFGCQSRVDDDQAKRALRFEIGAVSECGIRDSNEDSYMVTSDLLLASVHTGIDMSKTVWGNSESMHSPGLFAVFDGHCGDHAARFAAERLLTYIQARSFADTDDGATQSQRIQNVLREAISQLDDEFCNLCISGGRNWESGATALVAALVNEQLVIANLGDARGVMCRCVEDSTDVIEEGWTELPSTDYHKTKGTVFWKQVTSTHSPSRADERTRIENANGWITFEKEIPVGQLQRMVLFDEDVVDILKRCFADRIQTSPKAAAPQRILQISRVCGELAVSRAIGDRDFKSAYNVAGNPIRPQDEPSEGEWHNASLFLPYPDDHCRSFVGDLVSNVPDFESIKVGESGVSDEFLLLGCDGLWDVIDSDDAVRVTRDLLFEKGWSAKRAANRLAELAVHLGSSDNITVIVIRFMERSDT